jgi:hypothetical protein
MFLSSFAHHRFIVHESKRSLNGNRELVPLFSCQGLSCVLVFKASQIMLLQCHDLLTKPAFCVSFWEGSWCVLLYLLCLFTLSPRNRLFKQTEIKQTQQDKHIQEPVGVLTLATLLITEKVYNCHFYTPNESRLRTLSGTPYIWT